MPDLASLSLVELKKLAKVHEPPIKYYYVKSKSELLELLTMKEFPETMKIEKKKLSELRTEAIDKGYRNVWKLRRRELLELLYPEESQHIPVTPTNLSPRSNKDDEDNDHTQKHDDPEESERE